MHKEWSGFELGLVEDGKFQQSKEPFRHIRRRRSIPRLNFMVIFNASGLTRIQSFSEDRINHSEINTGQESAYPTILWGCQSGAAQPRKAALNGRE
jgi:hypothetical protein